VCLLGGSIPYTLLLRDAPCFVVPWLGLVCVVLQKIFVAFAQEGSSSSVKVVLCLFVLVPVWAGYL
jgi:hypothetical protein